MAFNRQAGAQTTKIKVKRDPYPFMFYQKGTRSDTIWRGRNDEFFLMVPDSLKEKLVFSTENGQLVRTANDSLIKLNYLHGLTYEYVYEVKDESNMLTLKEETGPRTKKPAAARPKPRVGVYKTLITGTTDYKAGHILLKVIHKTTGVALFEQVFYYSGHSK